MTRIRFMQDHPTGWGRVGPTFPVEPNLARAVTEGRPGGWLVQCGSRPSRAGHEASVPALGPSFPPSCLFGGTVQRSLACARGVLLPDEPESSGNPVQPLSR